MSVPKTNYGIPLSQRLSIVRAYANNPVYKPIITTLISTFNRLYIQGLYGVVGYAKLREIPRAEDLFETQLKNDANAVLQYIRLPRGDALVGVSVESVDVTASAVTARVAIEGGPFNTFTAAPEPSEPGFAEVWHGRLTASKERLRAGVQATDYEVVKQLAMLGWINKFGQYLPAIYQIKFQMGLGTVAGDTIKQRILEALDQKWDGGVALGKDKWANKARLILAGVNTSAVTVAWVIENTIAHTVPPR